MRRGDAQRGVVLGDRHTVRKRQIVGDQTDRSVRRDEHDVSGSGLTAGEVVSDVVHISVAVRVDHDVVPRLVRDGRQIGMEDEGTIGLAAQQPALCGVDHEQERRNLDHHLVVAAVRVEGDDLVGAPIGDHTRPSRQRGDSPNTIPSINTLMPGQTSNGVDIRRVRAPDAAQRGTSMRWSTVASWSSTHASVSSATYSRSRAFPVTRSFENSPMP